jgi:two-component system response regulator YesN
MIIGYRLKRRRVSATKGKGIDTALPKTRVMQAKDYINQNYHKPDVTLEKVSKEINISANYLSKQFKHEVGQSFPEYLNNIRLRKACDLLKISNLTISEIAYKVGYNTQEYFNKVFKASLKCTPGEYRQKYLEK